MKLIQHFSRSFLLLAAAFAMASTTGCTTAPYKYGASHTSPYPFELPAGEPQVERGVPNAFLDAADWFTPNSLIGKLVLWNAKVDSHEISPETEQAIVTYLAKNELPNVKVRINQWAPGAEWNRLFSNTSVGAGWRYTFGIFATLGYTIIPGRFFGGDNYNPYTNTINLYSDIPAVGLHEGGHAKDSANQKYPGTYAFLYVIPGVPLWHEAQATSDVLSYLQAESNIEGMKEAYNILYPAYGTYVGGTFGQFIDYPWSTIIQAGAVIPGHIIGRSKSAQLEE